MEFGNSVDMLSSIGTPVKIDILPLQKNAKSDTSVSGNIVAIDPDTRSMGLLQFHQGKPSHIMYIPGASIQDIHDLSDGPFDDSVNYKEYSDELREYIDKQFVKSDGDSHGYSDKEISQRCQKLTEFLHATSIKFEQESDGTLIVGAVKIRKPYSADSCFSNNQLALGRLRELINRAFA